MFGPSGFWTMAPLRYAAKFDPFLSLDCAPTPSTLAQSKERKGSNFAIWQPCEQSAASAATSLPFGSVTVRAMLQRSHLRVEVLNARHLRPVDVLSR